MFVKWTFLNVQFNLLCASVNCIFHRVLLPGVSGPCFCCTTREVRGIVDDSVHLQLCHLLNVVVSLGQLSSERLAKVWLSHCAWYQRGYVVPWFGMVYKLMAMIIVRMLTSCFESLGYHLIPLSLSLSLANLPSPVALTVFEFFS